MKRNIVALFGACVVLMTSCDLDYTNNGTINPDNVWSDKNMISFFFDRYLWKYVTRLACISE